MKKENNIWHDNPESSEGPRPPRLSRRFNQWFDHFFSMEIPDYVEVHTYAPPYEILENEKFYLMCLDLPGISRQDIKVEVIGNELVISGERVNQLPAGSRLPFKNRRRFGRFRRAFTLPPSVDEDRVQANCCHGVLEIAIPKRAEEKRRQIPIGESPESFLDLFREELHEVESEPQGSGEVVSFEDHNLSAELDLSDRGDSSDGKAA